MIQQDVNKASLQQQLNNLKQQAAASKIGVNYVENSPFSDVMAKYQKNRIGSTSTDQQKQ